MSIVLKATYEIVLKKVNGNFKLHFPYFFFHAMR